MLALAQLKAAGPATKLRVPFTLIGEVTSTMNVHSLILAGSAPLKH